MARVYQLLLILDRTREPTRIPLRVRPGSTYWELHGTIQEAAGWAHCHVHRFTVPGPHGLPLMVGVPEEYPNSPIIPGWIRLISKDLKAPGDEVGYEYDNPEGGHHRVVLQGVVEGSPGGIPSPGLADLRRAEGEEGEDGEEGEVRV